MGTPREGGGEREAVARVVKEPPNLVPRSHSFFPLAVRDLGTRLGTASRLKIACTNMVPKHARKRDAKREISPPQSLLPSCTLILLI